MKVAFEDYLHILSGCRDRPATAQAGARGRMKAAVVDAVGTRSGERFRCHQLGDGRPAEAVHELLPDGVGSVFDSENSREETESGYQKLADPEATRVVISRF
jgi:hypothetical protein